MDMISETGKARRNFRVPIGRDRAEKGNQLLDTCTTQLVGHRSCCPPEFSPTVTELTPQLLIPLVGDKYAAIAKVTCVVEKRL